ncbi:MAG TPA: hypothetical protein DCL66_05210 [Gammaproteobacteria bacterium]|nr:hypothetical protein [Gammaproteobacteria bacterium]
MIEDDHLLKAGSVWAGLNIFTGTNCGCKVTSARISDAQFKFAQEVIKTKGLKKKTTLLNQDYRSLIGKCKK